MNKEVHGRITKADHAERKSMNLAAGKLPPAAGRRNDVVQHCKMRCNPRKPNKLISVPPPSRNTPFYLLLDVKAMLTLKCRENAAQKAVTFAVLWYLQSRICKQNIKRPRSSHNELHGSEFAYHQGFSVQLQNVTACMDAKAFRRYFRLSRHAFGKLILRTKPVRERKFRQSCRTRRETLPHDIRLGITLRILAGADFQDVAYVFKVGPSTVYGIFDETIHELNDHLSFPGIPSDEEGLRSLAVGFKSSRRTLSPLDGCVSSVDGICIRIAKAEKHFNPAFHFCRKGFYALAVQAVCDFNYVFRYASALCCGATHDSLALALSGFMRELEAGILMETYWVAGDEAYQCTNSIIVPYPSLTLTKDEDNYNYYLSSMRIHIEQAFGLLTCRWRILKHGVLFGFEKCCVTVAVCMKLHNYCIENDSQHYRNASALDRLRDSLEVEELEQMERDNGKFVSKMRELYLSRLREHLLGNSNLRLQGGLEVGCGKRDVLKELVKEKGLVRPQPQASNSLQSPN